MLGLPKHTVSKCSYTGGLSFHVRLQWDTLQSIVVASQWEVIYGSLPALLPATTFPLAWRAKLGVGTSGCYEPLSAVSQLHLLPYVSCQVTASFLGHEVG